MLASGLCHRTRNDLEERREVDDDRGPQHVEVGVEVMLHKPIAHACCRGPRDRRILGRVSGVTCLAASPTISTSFVNTSRSISSSSRSDRLRPSRNRIAVSAASTRCRRRTSSSGGIKLSRSLPHPVAEEPAEVTVCTQLHLTADEVSEF
jgi:hypothetical protein